MASLRDLLLQAAAASELEEAVRSGEEDLVDLETVVVVRRKIYADLVRELIKYGKNTT